MQSRGIIANLIEFVGKLPETHLPTLAIGLLAIAIMVVSIRQRLQLAELHEDAQPAITRPCNA